jgi:ribosomal protein S18 acetylase RimI-like enzyme
MSLIIRRSAGSDFYSVMGLFRQLWPTKPLDEAKTKQVFFRSIEDETNVLLSAEIDDRVIGFGSMVILNNFWQESYIGYVTTLIVHEEARNQGIGRRILSELIINAEVRDCSAIELDSGFQREQAHKFYENFGFHRRAFLFSKEIKK